MQQKISWPGRLRHAAATARTAGASARSVTTGGQAAASTSGSAAAPACAADRNVVAAALSDLPAEYRSVIVEISCRGRSVPETADLLGVSADTVRVRCYDALRALKHALAERGLAA
jgi:RNA polymerase sigma-70 factor, ECF subfamily